MTLPMLADFSVRLAFGLALMLLITPWREVPVAFFRTHCLVILGLLALAGLDASRVEGSRSVVIAVVGAGVSGYLAAVAWGLGLPRLAVPLTVLISAVAGSTLIGLSDSPGQPAVVWNGVGRLASAVLMGSTLTAMLLGHHYLTAPAMSIEPLKRFVRCMALALAFRAALAGVGLYLWWGGGGTGAPVSPLFLTVRWGMGLFGPAIGTYMTWKTVEIRSTQSATGILYIAMTLVLFGELSAMVLSRDSGLPF